MHLNVDYFSPSENLELPTFLRLPVPHLPPPTLSTLPDLIPFLSPLDYSLRIHHFPIDSALSKFSSAVLPQIIDDANLGDFDVNVPSWSGKACFDENWLVQQENGIFSTEREVDGQTTFGYETLESVLAKKANGIAVDDKDASRCDVIQFETPELDALLENVCFFEEEDVQILSGVPEIENCLEMLRQELRMQDPCEVQGLIYSVEDFTSKYTMEQKAYVLEDDRSVQDQICCRQSLFPSLEVDETSLGTLTCLSIEEELLSLLENAEHLSWLQKDNMVNNVEELLGSRACDISQFLLAHCLSKDCPDHELAAMENFPEMDFISMVEHSQIQGNPSCKGKSQLDCLLAVTPVIFQELQFLDVDSSQLFGAVFNRQTAYEPEKCDWLFTEDMNFKNFNELIVSYELALVDNTFKSLPVPLFSDDEKIRSLCSIIEDILAGLEQLPRSASDEIYLDWHLLEEDKCNSRIYSSYHSMLEDVDSPTFDFDLGSFDDGKLVFEIVFSDNVLNRPKIEEKKESLNLLHHGISVSTAHDVGDISKKLLDDECLNPGNGEQLAEKDAERAFLLFKSMSQFNDLDFFLNPRKASAGEYSDSAIKAVVADATFSEVPSSNSSTACASTGVQLHHCDVVSYGVKLSDIIVAIVDNFEKSYLSILQNEREMIKTYIPFLAEENFKLLSLPKQKLMDCIKKINAQGTTSHRDENIKVFFTLCALKQMAWYVCFYGIHPTHQYVDKLCHSLEFLRSRLGNLWPLIEDAGRKVEREITSSHPSLTFIQEILHSSTTQGNLKVLIVAEEIFWWSLRSLLMSVGLSFSEFENYYAHANQSDLLKNDEDFINARMDALLVADCLLVSHEHVSASFPFNKFGVILEYGGSCGSSRINCLSPKLVGFPRLHFLKVELDKSSTSKALCEGVDMPRITEMATLTLPYMTMEESENMNIQKLEKLINFLPIEGKFTMGPLGAADEAEACCMPLPVPTVPFAMESENVSQIMVPSPERIIIVNTQNFDKQMIVSRRSTYQRILAMENEGAQVVERDSDLPVDVIISSAICLVWYDCRNIGKKAAALDEASSCLPLCIENVASNVLTLLSFTFSGCFLVFEGEISFLSNIMESSDGLYAAAASLGIDLQIFCSYSSEMTDEIILSCISYATKLTKGLYPKMPESETLAESFLTKFPSINPLMAHAILSSGGVLIEFLEWTPECRTRAIQKYNVSEESLTLFSALCKYGEREDSKSIMTDCSSVSSGPDSEKCHFNIGSGRRRKHSSSPHKIDLHMDALVNFETLYKFPDDALDPSPLSKPNNMWMSKDPKILDEFRKPSTLPNGIFGQKQGLDMDMLTNPSSFPNPWDSQFSKSPQMPNEIKKPYFSLSDIMPGHNQVSDTAMMNNLDWHGMRKSENQSGDIIGEVIDLTDSPVSGQDFSSIGSSMKFSLSVPEMDNYLTRKSKTARKLSFGKSSHATCSVAAEVNSNSDIWSFKKVQRQNFPEVANDYQVLLEEGSTERTAADSMGLAFQENKISSYGATPLSNALSSTHPQQNSPWTIEFLNRIREKSRLRQQSLPCDTSSPCLGYSGNISKVSKRKSPSILEFFKYQGSSMPRPEQKRQKKSVESSNSSKNKKASSSVFPTRTPSDKRARKTLSFAMNGSGSQSKLVWSDGTHGLSKKFRNQL
ncbi:protein SHORTAGE IN CHIASMATA 1 isoform X1 [Carya illinoinensis]|uniref:protein SHORTAGE IN CHIASMATA 1 isoform X1 n=2 Tax=Carya illinoinensis TaxID=32201 RepID=UPI001C7190C2|nr:protein SHORTAGE IN CHIASMATA 1 isoform X1 [Carya illinoinensis]XP_042975655.1 protein SHORTAGE IN CHIASMATA 1 isoform X1 [Carya illinoinensis]